VANSNIQEALEAYVYVISKEGKPLMPCSKAKARKLLKKKRARIVNYKPYTIQLNFSCENQIQKVTLGIDPGYEYIGLSAVSKKKELFSAQVKLINNISKLLIEKRMYRRARRKKKWHRKPRFLNRKKKKFPPSIQHKLDMHIKIIERIFSFLPIDNKTPKLVICNIKKEIYMGMKMLNLI
jgi:hypothetical protein